MLLKSKCCLKIQLWIIFGNSLVKLLITCGLYLTSLTHILVFTVTGIITLKILPAINCAWTVYSLEWIQMAYHVWLGLRTKSKIQLAMWLCRHNSNASVRAFFITTKDSPRVFSLFFGQSGASIKTTFLSNFFFFKIFVFYWIHDRNFYSAWQSKVK